MGGRSIGELEVDQRFVAPGMAARRTPVSSKANDAACAEILAAPGDGGHE
jgi:hypothetical protein